MVKHYLIEIDYLVPVETLGDTIRKHRECLQVGYDLGWILLSGPRVPATGGVLIARAHSLIEIQAFFENDPYHLQGLATHKFSEFLPVKHQGFLKDWITSEPSL